MLLGLLAGSTLASGSPLKGIAMTVLGLVLGMVGTDINSGAPRFTFGMPELYDGVETRRAGAGHVRHRRIPQEREQRRAASRLDINVARCATCGPNRADLKASASFRWSAAR